MELPDFVAYFFDEDFSFDSKAGERLFKKGEPLDRLTEVRAALTKVDDWNAESLDQAFSDLAESNGQDKPFQWFPVTRYTVSGTGGGPDLVPMLSVLGKERVLVRMDSFPYRYPT